MSGGKLKITATNAIVDLAEGLDGAGITLDCSTLEGIAKSNYPLNQADFQSVHSFSNSSCTHRGENAIKLQKHTLTCFLASALA
jgi:hypothetical protein